MTGAPPPSLPFGWPPSWRAGDPRLRFRVYIAGEIVAELWLDATMPDATSQVDAAVLAHKQLTDQADDLGEPWLVEIFDPAAPVHRAYIRFGTDRAAMTAPVKIIRLHGDYL